MNRAFDARGMLTKGEKADRVNTLGITVWCIILHEKFVHQSSSKTKGMVTYITPQQTLKRIPKEKIWVQSLAPFYLIS